MTAKQYPFDSKKVQMKDLRTVVIIAGICCFTATSFAQESKVPINEPDYNRPAQFDQLPARIAVTTAELDQVIHFQAGKKATISFASKSSLQFEGQVVSVADHAEQKFQSVVFRSTNFPGASFTIAKRVDEEGVITYTGRIISFQHADLFELKKENGNYFLVKRNFYDLVNE